MDPYIIGLVAADGHVRMDGGWLISQTEKNAGILKKIHKAFGGNLKASSNKGRYGSDPIYNLRYGKNVEVESLFENWGVPKGNKTYDLRFPENKPTNEMWDYLRGFFDGDGSIFMDGNYPRVQIISNVHWCLACLEYLKVLGISSYTHDDKRHPGISNVIIRRVNHVYSFMDGIYGGDSEFFLSEKKKKWQAFKKICSRVYERKAPRKITPDEIVLIKEGLQKGEKPVSISERLNIPVEPVRRISRECFGGRSALMKKKKERVREMLSQGFSGEHIKKQLHVSSRVISVVASDVSNLPVKRGRPIPEYVIEDMKQLLSKGNNATTIAEILGLKKSTVYSAVQRIKKGVL